MHPGVQLTLLILFASARNCLTDDVKPTERTYFVELTDDNWEEIQKGEWLIGIFHPQSPESAALQKDWNIFALKCKEFGIAVGRIKADKNPGLQVRFLAREFPKVFHINEGNVSVFPTATRDELVRIIKDKKWEELEPVVAPFHPFSMHLTIFAYICTRVLLLYNYEKELVSNYFLSPNALNIVFILTFIAIGTGVGLVFTCLFLLLKFAVQSFRKKPSRPSEQEKNTSAQASQVVLASKNTKLRKRKFKG